MASPLTRLIRRVRQQLSAPPEPEPDADLLARFAGQHDEVAFAALVARHGAMVLNLCRRVLGDAHAAEDAFQATFLVLARKAGSLTRPEALAGWLHGVACRVALKARRRTASRTPQPLSEAHEPADPRPDPLAELSARELLGVLEEEVRQLPQAYRLAVVLCCLEGLSQEEAAQRLSCTPGSIKARLERGRRRLHQRLQRRGLTLAAALGCVEVSRGMASAALLGTTVAAAVPFAAGALGEARVSETVIALAQEGLQAMSVSKVKMALVVLVSVGVLGAGMGWLATGPGKSGTPVTAAEAVEAEQGNRQKRAGAADRTLAEQRRISAEAEDVDRALSKQLVALRQQLVELEERLRTAEEMARAARVPSATELRLRREEERLEETVARQKRIARRPDEAELVEKQLDLVRRQLHDAEKERERMWKAKGYNPVPIRKEMVRVEEDIRLLERKRDVLREQSERRLDEAAERNAGGSDRRLRTLERKLDAIQRELDQLRREIRRQRR
jgi:RNA polymerase sigma factor (sigma-70 family)